MSKPPSYRERCTSQTKTSQPVHSTNVLHTHTLNCEVLQAGPVHNYGNYGPGGTAKLEKEVAALREELRDLKVFLEYNLKDSTTWLHYKDVNKVKADNERMAREREKEEALKREKEAQKKDREAWKRARAANSTGVKAKGRLMRFFDRLRSESTAPQKPGNLPGGVGNTSYFSDQKSEVPGGPHIRSNSRTGMPEV